MSAYWPTVWYRVPYTYKDGKIVYATWDAKRKVWVMPQ